MCTSGCLSRYIPFLCPMCSELNYFINIFTPSKAFWSYMGSSLIRQPTRACVQPCALLLTVMQPGVGALSDPGLAIWSTDRGAWRRGCSADTILSGCWPSCSALWSWQLIMRLRSPHSYTKSLRSICISERLQLLGMYCVWRALF